jgi:hypothetical protein
VIAGSRWARPAALGLTLLFAAYGLFVLATLATDGQYATLWGADRSIYAGATARWLAGGPFYFPFQVAGPYELYEGVVLYPPVALLALVPLTAMPAILWWAIPVGAVAAVIAYHRPAWWAWPLIAACLGFHWSVMLFATGNPTLWMAAAVALGTIYGWPAIAVVLKPTLAPFALLGIRRQSWWVAAAVGLAVSVPFGAMWIDWIHAALNAHGWRVGPLYSLGDVPWLLAPVLAWVSRTR